MRESIHSLRRLRCMGRHLVAEQQKAHDGTTDQQSLRYTVSAGHKPSPVEDNRHEVSICDLIKRLDVVEQHAFGQIQSGSLALRLSNAEFFIWGKKRLGTPLERLNRLEQHRDISIATTDDENELLVAKFSFCSWQGKYLSAQPDGTLDWNREKKGRWEVFTVRRQVNRQGHGRVSLQSCHGTYISSSPDGKLVACNQDQIGDWELFDLIQEVPGDASTVSLRTSHGCFLSCQEDGAVEWDRKEIGMWERFACGDDSIGHVEDSAMLMQPSVNELIVRLDIVEKDTFGQAQCGSLALRLSDAETSIWGKAQSGTSLERLGRLEHHKNINSMVYTGQTLQDSEHVTAPLQLNNDGIRAAMVVVAAQLRHLQTLPEVADDEIV